MLYCIGIVLPLFTKKHTKGLNAMDDNLIIEDNVLKGCRQSKIITVTIPEGIVAICDNAFSDFPNLMNISLPKSLSKIGNGVFQNCPKLTEIDLTDIAVIGEGVHKKFDEIMVPAGLSDVTIFTEMGRFMMGPYGSLVTRAIHEKHIYKEYIGVDACAANLMRPAMYGSYHHITVLGKENEPCDHTYDVTGSLCENNDKFAIDRKLPKIDMGDLLYIHDAGAHGFAMGYNYNGRLWSSELLLKEDGSVKCIRRAQTMRDYFATFDELPVFDAIEEAIEESGGF
jgi:hypothetical protein